MLKIGEFSRLAHITVKALRFYEKEGLLQPAAVDGQTGYRLYETAQLERAARIRSFRQMGLSIDSIRALLAGADAKKILAAQEERLRRERAGIDIRLSVIRHILEGDLMRYQVTTKQIPEMTVYYSEAVLKNEAERMSLIPELGAECLRLNPGLRCADPPYEFCEYLDAEHRDTGIRIRHTEAVTVSGREGGRICFKTLPAAKVLSIYHRGPYEEIADAYAFLMRYAEENGYTPAGLARECYIDGIWNRESPEEWLTEVQLPVE